jgi:hypothetical protein
MDAAIRGLALHDIGKPPVPVGYVEPGNGGAQGIDPDFHSMAVAERKYE